MGYPEWWDFTKKPRRKVGQASTATTKTEENPVAAHTESSNDYGMSNTTHSVNNEWIIDTGATDHMTNDPSKLLTITRPEKQKIKTANGGLAQVTCEGVAQVSSLMNLDTVLVVPSLSSNLLSISQIIDQLHCYVTFWPTKCTFQDIATDRMIGSGIRKGKLYYLEEERQAVANHVEGKKLKPELFLNKNNVEFNCDVCELAKSHRISYFPSEKKVDVPFMKVHSDVWGPARIPTPSGHRYFVTFIDECTRMVWVSLLKHKNEVVHVFQELYKLVKTQYKGEINILQSDNGGEYVNYHMHQFCKENSIRH